MAEAFFKGWYQKIDHHNSEAVAKQGSETGAQNKGPKQGGSQSSRFEANMPPLCSKALAFKKV